jgi:hypothetical protein
MTRDEGYDLLAPGVPIAGDCVSTERELFRIEQELILIKRELRQVRKAILLFVGTILIVTLAVGLYSLEYMDSLRGEFERLIQRLSSAITATKQHDSESGSA